MNVQAALPQTAANLLSRVNRAAAALWQRPHHPSLETAFDSEALLPVPEVVDSTWSAWIEAELACVGGLRA